MKPFFHKNIRLAAYNYKGQHWHFITICCEGRRREFVSAERAAWLIGHIGREAQSSRFAVHAYCVMPDHLHVLVVGLDANSDLLQFVRRLKEKTTREFHKTHSATLWQKKFYDYILRPRDSVSRVATYIWMNPVRKGLCNRPEDYPYSGSLAPSSATGPTRSDWLPPWKEKAPAYASRKQAAAT